MKQGWKKRLATVLALMLALAVLPLASVLAESAATATYGKVTADQVFLRKQPNTDADYWFRVDTNHVARILDEVVQNGKAWYKVETEHPDGNGHTYTGYIMKDFLAPMSAEETQNWLSGTAESPVSPEMIAPMSAAADTVISLAATNQQGEISADGTNFRMLPSTSGQKIMTLNRGTIVEILSVPEVIDTNHWYGVRYGGYSGFVMSTFVRLVPETMTGGMTVHGFVKLVTSSANLRSAPGGEIAVSNGWKTPNEIRPYVSTPVAAGGYTWYELVFDGVNYWVRSDCAQTVDSTGKAVTSPSGTTAPGSSSGTTKGYVVTTQSGVNLRLQPFGESFAQIKKGVVLPYEHIVEPYTANNNSQYRWFYVVYNSMHGYIRSDCAEITTNSGVTVTNTPSVTATPTPGVTYSYIKMTKTDVALRATPGGKVQERLAEGTVVSVTGAALNASNYLWYPVRTADGKTGYIRGDCATPCNADGGTGAPMPDVTAPPAATDVPTVTPAGGIYGYVQITMDKTFIRASMGGDKLFRVEQKGGIYPMWGPQNSKNGKVWYPVVVNGVNGWVLSDCARLVDQTGETVTPSVTETPSGNVQASTYVITVLDKVNIRASASKDAKAVANVALGTVMAFNTTTGSGNSLWYRVIYNNQEVWVLGTCVRIMTQAEYDQWLQQNPNDAPSTEVIKGYVKTIADKVNIRDAANGKTTGKQVEKSGTVLSYSETRTVGKVVWYYITTSDGFHGWLNGNFVIETDNSGTAPATTPPSSGGNDYVPPTKGQEASYTTLKRGSSGTAVTNLVTELKMQGYYTGAITSSYTEAVEEAVKAFQKAKGLTADGIAGSDTQHALFQTVPVGSASNSDFTFYPAEKNDWFTGTINQEWARGTNAKVYDIKTGIVWTLHRWSGGNHVEAEPLTAADTAKMCKAYGVSKASQIPWNYRPILVLIGEHNYCASIYAEEHAPELDTIPNNNFSGPMCVHFTNSKTHDTDRINSGHQENIQYAYEHAPGGQKK